MRATFSTKHLNRKFKVSTKSMYKIQVATCKVIKSFSKSKFINTKQMSIHLFPFMHLYALHQQLCLECVILSHKIAPQIQLKFSTLKCHKKKVCELLLSYFVFADWQCYCNFHSTGTCQYSEIHVAY